MSHELRTPLNAIIGYSEMLQEEAGETQHPEFIPDLQRLDSAGKHLLHLINDILELSKVEAGKVDLFLETFEHRKASDRGDRDDRTDRKEEQQYFHGALRPRRWANACRRYPGEPVSVQSVEQRLEVRAVGLV